MPTPIRIEGLLAKIEATYRTDSVPVAGTDGVRMAERGWSALSIEYQYPNIRDDVATGTLLPVLPGRPEGRIVTGTIVLELKGFGAVYTAVNLPEADMFWRACGYSQTVDLSVGTENVKYAPADSSHESLTMHAFAAGSRYEIIGVRCNPIWPINAGELGMLRFEFQGFLDVGPVAAALPTITYNATVPQPGVTTAIAVGAVTLDAPASLEVNGGVELIRIPDANDASGVSEIAIVRHRPTVRIRTLTESLATFNPYGDWDTSGSRLIDATVGATQYNRAKLNISNAFTESIAHADQDGLTAWDLGYFSTDLTVLYD